jgi:hypothetical protein
MALSQSLKSDVSAESRSMIDEFLLNKKATQVQPFLAPGNEAPRHVRELVALRRREFRQAKKAAQG